MLDFEQQANQAQALASLDEDWHLLEGERTTFAIFLLYALHVRCEPATGQWRRRYIGAHLVKPMSRWIYLVDPFRHIGFVLVVQIYRVFKTKKYSWKGRPLDMIHFFLFRFVTDNCFSIRIRHLRHSTMKYVLVSCHTVQRVLFRGRLSRMRSNRVGLQLEIIKLRDVDIENKCSTTVYGRCLVKRCVSYRIVRISKQVNVNRNANFSKDTPIES